VLQSVTKGWILAGSIAVLLAAGIGWFISNRLTAPLIALTHSTQSMASGDLSTRNTIQRNDELGILAQSFNRMAEQIENNFTTLKRFVADAAHEIHTPITALRTNLELSVEKSPTPQSKQALNQVMQLEHLTNDLLDLSQIEGAIQADFKALDVNTLLIQISEIYASRAEQADLDFQLALPEQPICIEANPSQIERVVSNLLDNAIKFTPQGGTIHVELQPNAKNVYLSVRDTGIGIPPDDQPLLFERFKRGRNVSNYAGSGLGLAIVKAIVDSHSGSVQAESDTGGTCIKVALPMQT
jgi:signal transduction histidine kinase